MQDLEQAKIEATAALEQAQTHQTAAETAQQAAQNAQSSIRALQRQATEAETALASATASWEAERTTLEAAAAAASAEDVEQRVQAAVAGNLKHCRMRQCLLGIRASFLSVIPSYSPAFEAVQLPVFLGQGNLVWPSINRHAIAQCLSPANGSACTVNSFCKDTRC